MVKKKSKKERKLLKETKNKVGDDNEAREVFKSSKSNVDNIKQESIMIMSKPSLVRYKEGVETEKRGESNSQVISQKFSQLSKSSVRYKQSEEMMKGSGTKMQAVTSEKSGESNGQVLSQKSSQLTSKSSIRYKQSEEMMNGSRTIIQESTSSVKGKESADIKKPSSQKRTRHGSKRLTASQTKEKSELSINDDYSSSSEESEINSLVKHKKSKKKPGKGKKKEKIVMTSEKKAIDLASEEQRRKSQPKIQDKFLVELARIKAAAAAAKQIVVPDTESGAKEISHVEKKRLKKAKAKKGTHKSVESLKSEQDEEVAKQAELERMHSEQEKALEKYKRDIVEQQIREEQLGKSINARNDMIAYNMKLARDERTEQDWQLYIKCGRLPNPARCDQMTTYIHLWRKVIEHTTIEEASKRTSDVIELLNDLDDLLDTASVQDDKKVENWKWLYGLLREYQNLSLNIGTYRLLRCVEKNMHRIDLYTADFDFVDDYMTLSIWLRIQLPIPLPNPRRPPKSRLDVSFPKITMQVLFPMSIDCEKMAIRVMHLKYDHLSDQCETFKTPDIPVELTQDLLQAVKDEWHTQQKYKYYNRDKPIISEIQSSTQKSDSDHLIENRLVLTEVSEVLASDNEIPNVPYKKLDPTASVFAVIKEDLWYNDTRKNFLLDVPDYVLNMRKYAILGGIFHLNLLFQPPQPQEFVTMDMNVTGLYLPKELKYVPFCATYPENPGDENTSSIDLEQEKKLKEEELDKLMLIEITWPKHVIFLQLPIVCQWKEDEKYWRTADIQELRHNAESGIVSFRTGLFGIFGLATIRYANLPYQSWEIKPLLNGSIMLQITASVLSLQFNVKDGMICIEQLENSPNNALQDLIGVYLKMHKLKRLMREVGVDIFPEPDTFCYVEKACEKHWPMEKHLYYDMAKLSNSFNFSWSHWNFAAGRRCAILQMREFSPTETKHKNYSLLLVTPLKATFLECTEGSQEFRNDEMENLKFSSDLYNLMKNTSRIAIRKKVQTIPQESIFPLAELLISTRILSFS